MRVKTTLLAVSLSVLPLSTIAAKADGLDNTYYISVTTGGNYTTPGQGSSGSYAAILNVSSQAQGVDTYGRTYSVLAMSHADAGGFGLYASTSLTGGTLSPYGLSGAQADAYANMSFDFLVPAGVYSIGEVLNADGHGGGTTGPDAVVSGNYESFMGLEGGESASCSMGLDGQSNVKDCGPVAVTPGEFVTFSQGAGMVISSFEPGDSGLLDYWGTFKTELDYYDANGSFIGQYDFPSPSVDASTPEPSSLCLLGTGLIGVGAAVRRRLIA